MNVYNFSLIITQPTVDEETAANKLFESGCVDMLFSVSNRTCELEFDREANSIEEAILSAIKDINKAEIGAKVVGIIPDNIININFVRQ